MKKEPIETRKKVARILCDVNLWGASYVIDVSKSYQEKKDKAKECTIVNGHLNNLYSDKDKILKHGFPVLYKNQRCVGIYPIFEDIDPKDKPNVKTCNNYDISEQCPFPLTHHLYAPNCLQFLY